MKFRLVKIDDVGFVLYRNPETGFFTPDKSKAQIFDNYEDAEFILDLEESEPKNNKSTLIIEAIREGDND